MIDKNFILRIKSFVRSLFNKTNGTEFKYYGDLTYWDNFEDFDSNWDWREHWGAIHPEFPNHKNTPDTAFVRDNQLIISQKRFKDKIHTGKAISKAVFYHGLFVFEAKLPVGKNLWPAIWFTGYNSWPPEIDLLEAYSNKRGNWRLTGNVHYSTPEKSHNSVGAKRFWIADHKDRWIQYAVDWREDYIKLYADGFLIREINDPVVMDRFKVPMHIIFTNMSTSTDIDYSEFKIRNIKVYQDTDSYIINTNN